MKNIAWRKWAPLIVLLLLCVIFGALNPNFLSVRNFTRIGISAAPVLLVAIGATFVIIMGSIDLSMEGAIALCSVSLAMILIALGGSDMDVIRWLAIPACMLVGALVGLLNGLAHVKLRIPSFMSSLSMSFVAAGATLVLTGGYRITVSDDAFRALLTYRPLGQPLMIYVAIAGLLLALFIERQTVIGRNFFAVGGGEDIARASGLNVDRIRLIGFTLAGLFFSLGAILTVAKLGIADGDSGSNMMFASITAVVVGGTSLAGGQGGVLNTLIGVLIVNVISNGMIVIGLPSYLQSGVLGVLVIVAIILSMDSRSTLHAK